MLKSSALGLASAALCLALGVPAAYAQSGQGQGDTKVVIKDDTTPKVKKGGQAVSDASVTTAVKTRLMKDKVARGTDIDVKTEHGVVTIAGAVPSTADKTRIGSLVARTTGVKRVDNQLTVSGTAGTAGTTGKKDDDTLNIKVKNDLPNVKVKDNTPDVKIKDDGPAKVKVKDNTPDVKIKDDGPNVKIKDDTTPAVKKGAKAVKGAAEKTSDVIVDAAKKTAGVATDAAHKTADVSTDASVATAVKTRLMKDDVARSTAIDVKADDGVVTITGSVPTAADKTRIGQLVADTAGVKRVVNNLTVK